MATRHESVAGGGGGACAWEWWRPIVAELVATALLVGLGVASVLPVHGPGPAPLAHPAFAFGFVVVGNAIAFGPVSGAHMNPAVTLAAVALRRLPVLTALGYVVAQAAGALLGFGALLAAVPAATFTGCTMPGPGVSPVAAAAIEAALTGVLVLACCGIWSGPPDDSASLKLGLVVAGLVFSGGEATGASLNPVRSLAPALFQGVWEHHWVYWVGPLAGSALAVLLHRFVLCVQAPPTPPTLFEEVPLHDKP